MTDWLDTIKTKIDDEVDLHLGDDATLTASDGTVYDNLRGPFEHDEILEDSGDGRVYVLKATYSVQSQFIPADPRNALFECRGKRYIVSDFTHTDNIDDGRVVLILDKYAAT